MSRASTKLATHLARNRITQSAFAATICKSVATVSRLANGLQRPDLATAVTIERQTDGEVPAGDWMESDEPSEDAA